MDNYKFDITAEGKETLAHAVAIAFPKTRKATHYAVQRLIQSKTEYITEWKEDPKGVPTLIFFWYEDKAATKLPYDLDRDSAIEFVTQWLRQADYGRQPSHDGDNGKGFRIFSETWGMVRGYQSSFVAIQPAWAMYGK